MKSTFRSIDCRYKYLKGVIVFVCSAKVREQPTQQTGGRTNLVSAVNIPIVDEIVSSQLLGDCDKPVTVLQVKVNQNHVSLANRQHGTSQIYRHCHHYMLLVEYTFSVEAN
jgi:hypothetical protein